MPNGLLVLFGSGETASTGKAIHRKVFEFLGKRDQRVAVLETPAGFQPNSEFVANEVANVFRKNLGEFVSSVDVIPAKRRAADPRYHFLDTLGSESSLISSSPLGQSETNVLSGSSSVVSKMTSSGQPVRMRNSTDNPEILEPVKQASYIFLGPGSPTYAKRQLENSLALSIILDRWTNGATVALSSAAALAAGNFTLPVYEIYKAGSDLYWEIGLRLTEKIGLNLTIVTHWNNLEGGKDLDTSRCFMGKKRFTDLEKLLPAGEAILGIDEHTAVIIDPAAAPSDGAAGVLTVMGKGSGWLVKNGKENQLKNGIAYKLGALRIGLVEEAEVNSQKHFLARATERMAEIQVGEADINKEILILLRRRKIARDEGLFEEADEIRKELKKLGYEVRDEASGQKVYAN